MKRVLLFFIIAIISCPFFVYADSASSSIVMDVSSGRILYSNNINEKRLIASITKIMTSIIVLENNDLEESITVGEEILSMYGTSIYLEVGEVLTVKDLLYGLMLRSGNDAAITLAVQTEGSEEEFVLKMNKKAKEIGMKDTLFNNSHGLDEETKNYSTAYDMALLSKYAYQNKDYQKIIATKKYETKSSLKSYVWYNRMRLFQNYKNCIGGKNGYTPKAGKTLVSLAKKDGLLLTAVSLNDSDIYYNHEKLYEKAFQKYHLYTILDSNGFFINSYFLDKDIYLKNSFQYPLTQEEIDSVTTLVKVNEHVSKEDEVGEVIIKLKQEEIGKVPIYQKSEKKEGLSFFQKLLKLIL